MARVWGPTQAGAFKETKTELAGPTTLGLYNPDAPTKICADALAYGLGAVLLRQQHDDEWKPVVFASRSMMETEKRYSQIEKEALALVWACEKFPTMSLEKQSYWRQTTSLWYPSDMEDQPGLPDTLSRAPVIPQMLATCWKMRRLKHLCMHLPPTCQLVRTASNSFGLHI